jgi:hypothetical protein
MIQERFVVTWELQRGLLERIRNKDIKSGIFSENFAGMEETVLYMQAIYKINLLDWRVSPDGDSLFSITTNPFDGKTYKWKITSLVTSDHQLDDDYTLVSN